MSTCFAGPASSWNRVSIFKALHQGVGSSNSSSQRRVVCNAKLNANLESSTEIMRLGRSDLQVSKLGIGTLQWGDPGSGFGSTFGEAEIASAFDELIAGGINFFDTAEVYGYQNIKSGSSSEQLLGKFLRDMKNQQDVPPVVANKFFTIPWTNFLVGGGFRLGRKSLLAALRESLKRIGKAKVDLYQIHFPFPTFSNAALMESLKEAVEEGLTRAVGVSNFSKEQMEEADDVLSRYGIPLASNQVRYSLISRDVEENGLLKACKDRKIQLIAYSPLASGLLTDKALTRTDAKATNIQPLLKLMQSIGAEHGDKSVTQVALNYLMCKGALPIAGCKNAQQAKAHCEVLKFKLTDGQVASLQDKAKTLKL